MENLLIGIVASFVMFLLFFLVFLIRGRNETVTGRLHGCGQPEGQCHCRQNDALVSREGFDLHGRNSERRPTPESTCARDAPARTSTDQRQKPS